MTSKSVGAHVEWMAKAGEDELSIRAVIEGGGAPSTACFLSQQMAEKYLKGLAVFYELSFPKVHDLLALETLLFRCGPDITVLHEALTLLNRYYIETRYPGDYPTFSEGDARDALAAAEQVKEFVFCQIEK